jgi:hypothetical protein
MAVLYSGCAKAPEAEVASTKTAIEAAKTVEADKYLAARYANAVKAFEAAQAEIDTQNTEFVLTRNYAEAKRLLDIATTLATALQADVAGAKEQMKVDVTASIEAAKAAIEESRGDMKKARRPKKVVAEMKENLEAAGALLVEAADEIEAGNVVGGRDKVGQANKKLKKVADRLATAGGGGLM